MRKVFTTSSELTARCCNELEVLVEKKEYSISDGLWGGLAVYPRMIYVHTCQQNRRKARIKGIVCATTAIPRI